MASGEGKMAQLSHEISQYEDMITEKRRLLEHERMRLARIEQGIPEIAEAPTAPVVVSGTCLLVYVCFVITFNF
jgi:hypothetical protein